MESIIGNADAIAYLAYEFENGKSISGNMDLIKQLYELASKKGSISAAYNLGQIYSEERNFKKAFKWWKKAADQLHPLALCDLGVAYENAFGTKKKYKQAVNCYKKAAELGDVIAEFNYGRCLLLGVGIKRDFLLGVKILKKIRPALKKLKNKGDKNALSCLNKIGGLLKMNPPSQSIPGQGRTS